MSRELLGEIIEGFALALVLYNCAWALRNFVTPMRRKGVLVALIFSLMLVVGPLGVFVSDFEPQMMSGIHFAALLVMYIVSIVGYEICIQYLLRRAVFLDKLQRSRE